MTVHVEDDRIRLLGAARVEDAEPLSVALGAAPEAPVDLSGCTEVHGAVMQALLVHRAQVEGLDDHPHLGWLAALLEASRQAGPQT
jgi:hypothetical protein